MKIPKLFKKAAAFVMAAVTALSIMPATAFAAGDIGTISFSHTYDSNGNAMRYNSSVILSILVDTFSSRISLTMPPIPKSHNTACVLSWEEAHHWQSRSSGCSSSLGSISK